MSGTGRCFYPDKDSLVGVFFFDMQIYMASAGLLC